MRSASRLAPLLTLLLAGDPFVSRADDLYVICHPSVSVSPADLRDVFLGEKQFSGAIRLTPAENRAAQREFLDKVLKMTPEKYLTAWTKKSFRDGVNPPPMNSSDAEAREFVRRVAGSCSYIRTDPGPGVTVAAKF